MVNYYDELEIEDFVWDAKAKVYHYPCPCGDRFEISKSQLRNGEEIATCPSCSLIVRVIYDYVRQLGLFCTGGSVCRRSTGIEVATDPGRAS